MRKYILILMSMFLVVLAGCKESKVHEMIEPKASQETMETQEPMEQATILPKLNAISKEDMLYDLDYLIGLVQDNYPFLKVNQRLNGVDWLKEAEIYRKSAPSTASYEEFINWLQNLVAKFNNGHARVISSNAEYLYYLSAYKTMEEKKPWSDLLVQPPVQEVYGALSGRELKTTKSTHQNSSDVMVTFLNDKTAYLNLPSFDVNLIEGHMNTLSAVLPTIKEAETLIIDIRENSGGSDSYWMKLVQQLISEPVDFHFYNLIRGTYIKPFIETGSGMSYESFRHVQDLPQSVVIESNRDIIQDFSRFFINRIKLTPENSIHFKGKIYLLIGPKVFSSSEKFACFAKTTGWATLVGERTGGDGLGMDPVLIQLPKSNLMIKLPLIMGITENGVINEEKKTEPDLWVNSVKSSILLQDQAIRAVLEEQ